jgi:hypothetical protein
MRPEHLRQERTRSSALQIAGAVLLFHLMLLLAMGLFVLLLGVSIGMLVTGLVALGVGWRALTIRAPRTDPSRLADLREYPGLAEALQDAASRVGAPLPDGVRITAAARIYAREEGGLLGGLFGSRRLLVVGTAALPFLTETEARALLARALARWGRRETWYAVQAQRVELATLLMVEHLGAAWTRWVNPVYWLFRSFQRAFGRLLASYGRERELWADQMAALAYTPADAEGAVKKQALYDAFWLEELSAEFTGGPTRPLQQVWERMQEACQVYGRWEDLWERLLAAPARPQDPEPTLGDRLEALAASIAMPPPGKPALVPATAILLR